MKTGIQEKIEKAKIYKKKKLSQESEPNDDLVDVSEVKNKLSADVVYKLTSKVDAKGNKIPSRFGASAPLKFVDKGKSVSIDKGLKIQAPMFEFMDLYKGEVHHTGQTISLNTDQVKETGKKFVKISGPQKKYEIK